MNRQWGLRSDLSEISRIPKGRTVPAPGRRHGRFGVGGWGDVRFVKVGVGAVSFGGKGSMSRNRGGAAAIDSPGNETLMPLVVDLLLHSFVEPGVPVTEIYERASKRFRIRGFCLEFLLATSSPHPLREFDGRGFRDRQSGRTSPTR